MGLLIATIVVGIGATLLMDLWMLLRRRAFGTPLPDYAMVGRWFGHMARGRFRHERIAAAPKLPGELAIGWSAHYAIGIGYAALLVAIWGQAWLQQPTPWPALAVGIGSVVAPLLVMQPAIGAGIAASRTPDPAVARAHSLITHIVFGLALYAAGCANSFLPQVR